MEHASTSNSRQDAIEHVVSVIEPVNSRATSGASERRAARRRA
jgi:hypothetical protein